MLKVKADPTLFDKMKKIGDNYKSLFDNAAAIVQNDMEVSPEDCASWYDEMIKALNTQHQEAIAAINEISQKIIKDNQ
jgi:hypothetical protein